MNKIKLTTILFFSFIFSYVTFGQTEEEIKSDVPELKALHEVIFKLWHDAWQNKNIELLKELVPAIDSHAVKIQSAKLPNILQDKKVKWNEGLTKLKEIVNEYHKAATTTDTQKILDAAEKLHAQYEKLARMIKPVLKEVEAFHQILYTLYHYYMPEYNKDKIKASVLDLQRKMEDLNKAVLPDHLSQKKEIV